MSGASVWCNWCNRELGRAEGDEFYVAGKRALLHYLLSEHQEQCPNRPRLLVPAKG